jgi:hypothetical protein
MLTGGTGGRALVLATLALVLSAAAASAAPAAVTISACKSDSVVVAGKVELAGSAARRARGATLQLRFQALALFGLPHSGAWRNAGRRTSGSGQQLFTGLAADNWIGVMNWRFKKGSRTVAAGTERSQPVRVGSSRGSASCTIAEGLKPTDTKPPAMFIAPGDDNWHRAPAPVQLIATDDLSGVKNVSSSLDGGPLMQIPNGSAFTISAQGVHRVDWSATDVAGNTATRSDTVRVDAGPPSKPALAKPPAVTSSSRPAFQWSGSTDSGSGVGHYVLIVKRGDGSIVDFQTLGATATSAQSGPTLNEGETYTATVTAVDNTVDSPWTQESDPISFRVDGNPDASFNPAGGTILSGGQKSTNFTITLDRAADPSTVSPATVKLTRGGTDIPRSAGCSNTPCTVITVDPNSDLTEGRYVLSLNGVKSAAEGLTFGAGASYAVPFVENGTGPTSTSPLCPTTDPPAMSTTYAVSQADAGTRAFIEFDMSASTGWTATLAQGADSASVSGTSAGGHFRLEIPSESSGTVTFRLDADCTGGSGSRSASASNLFGSRIP